MSDLSQWDTIVFVTQVIVGGYCILRRYDVRLIFLSPTATYWIGNESAPLPVRIAGWIVGGGGSLLVSYIVLAALWQSWRNWYLNASVKALKNGDSNKALHWIFEEKKRRGVSGNYYAFYAQVLMATQRFDECLALMDTAKEEGYFGASLDWFRVWSLCRLNRHADALTWLEQQLTNHSESETMSALYLIYYARVYIDLGQTENAREVHQQLERWFVIYRELIPLSMKDFVMEKYEECTKLFEAHLRGESPEKESLQ